jgi:putative salt-induced outer membrane protein YdiY
MMEPRTSMRAPVSLLCQLAAVSLAWSSGLGAAPKTDVLVLVNGDRITGEVTQLERGLLSYNTDAAGTLRVEWRRIAQLQSDQLLEIELMDGTRLYGKPSRLGESGSLLLELEGSARTAHVQLERTVRIATLSQGRPLDRLDAEVNFGWSAASANDVSQVSLGAGATYRDPVRLWKLDYVGSRSDSEDGPASHSHSLLIDQRRFLRERWFWSGLGSVERSDEQGIDLRLLLGGGFGRYLIQTGKQELAAAAGLGVTREELADGTDQESLEGILLASYEVFRFDDPELDVSSHVQVFPSFSVSGRVRMNSGIVLSYEFLKDFTYRLSFTHSFDSKPQAAGAMQSDWQVVTSIGYDF